MKAQRSLLGSCHEASALRRELLIAGVCLVTGLLVMPLAVWLVGRSTLGEYAHGGPLALLGDYLSGLGRGELAFWLMLIGPYAFALLIRGMRYAARRAGS